MKMTDQEIQQVTKEVEDFKAKSTQYITSSPLLSAHYHRLYMASKNSLKSFDRVKRSLADKQYREERKQLRKNASGGKSASSPK
jgi:hypothetical protein